MEVIQLTAQEWLERATALKADGWWATSLAGVDRLGIARDGGARFEVVAHLVHLEKKQRMRVHVVAEGKPPTVPSVTSVWPVTNFQEREAYDMYGIHFEGHPKLTRILMPDEWEGHPLRKDYGVGKVPLEFVPQPFLQTNAPGQSPVVEEAGREVDALGQPAGSASDGEWRGRAEANANRSNDPATGDRQ